MKPCYYNPVQATSVACVGAALFTVHDRRGCREVCIAHANWLTLHSWMLGHGSECPSLRDVKNAPLGPNHPRSSNR